MLAPSFGANKKEVPIVKTVALHKEGTTELWKKIEEHLQSAHFNQRKNWLLAEKAYQLIQKKRMSDIDKAVLKEQIATQSSNGNFNLYKFVSGY